MKIRFHRSPGRLTALALLLASLAGPAWASPRNSAAYSLPSEALGAAGAASASAAYSQQSILDALGAPTASAAFGLTGGFLITVAGGADVNTQPPTLVAPLAGSTSGSPIGVNFTLPEAAKPGSVTLTFTGTVTRALTLADALGSLGQHAFSFNPASPLTGGNIVSGTAIPDGIYMVTLSYQDTLSNPAAAAMAASVTVDTTPPLVASLAPLSVDADAAGHAPMPDLRSLLLANASDNLTTLTVAHITQTPAAAAVLTAGTVEVAFQVTDNAGNTTPSATTLAVAFPRPSGTTLAVGGAVGAAVTGAAAPGAGTGGLPADALLGTFGPPAVSDFRDLAARATMTSGRKKLDGIYVQDGVTGTGALPAFVGMPAPGLAATVTFKSFSDPVIAPGGAIAFAAKLQGVKATEDQGVWTDAFGNGLELALQENRQVPGLPAGVLLKAVTSISLQDGELVALVTLAGKNVVTASTATALMRLTSAAAGTKLLRTGDAPLGSAIKTIAVLAPALGSPGQGRWHAADAVAAKLTLADKRIFVVSVAGDGTITSRVRAGETDPGLGVKLTKLGVPSLATGGWLAVHGTESPAPGPTADTANSLLFPAVGPALTSAVRVGSAASGTDGVFASFLDPVANDQGMMLLAATLRGGTVKTANKRGLWTFDSAASALHLEARLGDKAKDKDGNDLADTALSAFTSFALPDGDGAGPVFIATLSGKAVTAKDKTGLWAVDSQGTLRLLLRTNADVPIGAATKKLASLTLLNSPAGSFGARRSYNATGAVAVLATFTDKTQALVRIDIP